MNTQTETWNNGRSIQRNGSAYPRSAVRIPTPTFSLFGAPSHLLTSSFAKTPLDHFVSDLQAELDRGLSALGLAPSTPAVAEPLNEKSEGLWALPWTPVMEVFRQGDQYVVQADLPGLRRDDVDISIHEDVLVISGERKRKNEEHQNAAHHTGRAYGRFVRTFTLPDNVIQDSISASLTDGVLEIRLPLPQQPEKVARKIEIK